jgi:hypothetical protein
MSEQTSSHPKSSPQTLTMNFGRQWSIVRPRLYRHLEAKYVEGFFSDGSLRLSSFAHFAQHPDEQLRDTAEGIGSRFGIGSQATIAMVSGRGRDCYVLCATLHNTEGVRKQFGHSNACIAIDDILGFANAISLKLPYFTQGFEGPVIYQDETAIFKNIGAAAAEELMGRYRNPDGTLRMEMLQDMAGMGGIEEYFIKHSRHAQECEYRLLWATSQTVEPFIDIKAPDARRFCRHVTTES